MARELGWDEARLERELEAFGQEARAEGIAPAGSPDSPAPAATIADGGP